VDRQKTERWLGKYPVPDPRPRREDRLNCVSFFVGELWKRVIAFSVLAAVWAIWTEQFWGLGEQVPGLPRTARTAGKPIVFNSKPSMAAPYANLKRELSLPSRNS
jgi:hypothetical protein